MEENLLGDAHEQAGISPDVHVGFALLLREVAPKRCGMPHQAAGERGTGQEHVGGADRHAVPVLVPLVGTEQQASGLSVYQPNPQRQPPTVAPGVHSARQVLLDKLHSVRLEAAHAHVHDPAANAERLADQRRKPLDDASADQRREDDVRIAQKGPRGDPGESSVVPVRNVFGLGEELAKRFGNAGERRTGTVERPSEHRVDFARRQPRQILRHGVRRRIVFGRMADVGLRHFGIVLPCRQISRLIGFRDSQSQRRPPNSGGPEPVGWRSKDRPA